MTIISIDGGDVKPIFLPAKRASDPLALYGIELSVAERYVPLAVVN